MLILCGQKANSIAPSELFAEIHSVGVPAPMILVILAYPPFCLSVFGVL